MPKSNPLNDLRVFAESLRAFLNEDNENETFAPPGIARRAVDAIAAYLDEKHDSLDHAFGLVGPANAPKIVGGERFDLYCDAYELKYRTENGLKRKWPDVASELDTLEKFNVSHRALRKAVDVDFKDRIEAHFRKVDALRISRAVARKFKPRPKRVIKLNRS
jgi:hypothetical protein